jgi:cytochrome c oxidase subunit 2
MRRRVRTWAALWALQLVGGVASAESGFDYCLLCHGDNANGNYGIRAPKLSGMEPWYLARQLENFAAGIRGKADADGPGQEMAPVALRVKQQDVLAAAVAWIGTLHSKKPVTTVTGDVARGEQLYRTCAACHGGKAEGNAQLQAPALASRSDWYLVTQLRNYRAGLRGADERDVLGAQMRAIGAALPDEQSINDVVAFINTL